VVEQLVFRFILGVGVCAFPHVLGVEKSKKLPPTSLKIISGIALSSGCSRAAQGPKFKIPLL